MIPYLLAIAGGYLLGDSMKSSTEYADGGSTDDGGQRLADNPKWTNEELLAKYNDLKISLEDLKEGKITPRKIIGGGYKSSAVAKRIAKEWLEREITKYARALKIRGVMADGGSMKSSTPQFADGGNLEAGKVLVTEYASQNDYEQNDSLREMAFNDFQEADMFARIEHNRNGRKFVVFNIPTKQYFYFGLKETMADGGMMADGGETKKQIKK